MRLDSAEKIRDWLASMGYWPINVYASTLFAGGGLISPHDHIHHSPNFSKLRGKVDVSLGGETLDKADVMAYGRELVRKRMCQPGKERPAYIPLELGNNPISLQTKQESWRTEFPEWAQVIDRPWQLQSFIDARFPSDFVHISYKSPGMVAYNAEYVHLLQDRQTITTLGRYLNRRFPEVPQYIRAALANRFTQECGFAELRFATTRDEIRRVYTCGPSSCMGKGTDHFNTDGIHPAEAYASPDFAVAYAEDANGRITARAVVSTKDPDNKRYNTIYGNADLLGTLLANDGWEPDIDFTDHRFLAIEVHGNYVGPYVDGTCTDVYTIVGDSDHLVIHPAKTRIGYSVGETQNSHDSGGFFGNENTESCECCGDTVNTDCDGYDRTVDGDLICSSCCDSEYVVASDGNTWPNYYAVDRDDAVYVVSNRQWYMDEDAAERAGFRQLGDDWYPADEVFTDDHADEPAHIDTRISAPLLEGEYSTDFHHTVEVMWITADRDFEPLVGMYPETVIEEDPDFELVEGHWVRWPSCEITQEEFNENQAA